MGKYGPKALVMLILRLADEDGILRCCSLGITDPTFPSRSMDLKLEFLTALQVTQFRALKARPGLCDM